MDNLSNCRFIPPTKSKGFSECRGIFQKVFLFLFLGVFLFSGDLLAQGQGNGGNNNDVGTTVDGTDGFTVITTATPFAINNPSCPQNNVSVDLVQFRNEQGGEFDAQFLADNYELGELVPGTIWIRVQRSGGAQAYNPHVQYDVFLDGEESGTIATCVRTVDSDGPNPNTINLEDNTFYEVANFSWEYGKLFEIKNFYMIWNTGNASSSDVSCPDGSGNSQCFFEADGFTVNTPLVPQFDFTTDCSLEVDFTNETTGGDPELPYTYSWDFGGEGVSSLENPSFTFPEAGTYSVTLTVTNDGVSLSQTQDVTVYAPITIVSSKDDIQCAEGTGGVIEITQLTGGFGDYTIEWTSDDEGFVFDNPTSLIQSNLPVGTYTVIVTDERGCTNSQEYNITQQGQAPAPTVEDQTVCQTVGSLSYDVTATDGFELIYFATETSETPITPSAVDTNVPGIYSVWVSQSNEFGCESARVEVSITVVKQPAPPVLIVPEPDCDAETVTITFTEEEDVEYSLNSDFSSFIVDGSFTANVESSGTVYARTIGSICVSSSDYDVE
ncbi:MAG: PKD domain-containing protein, partial [Bacteroidota bacterium]